ncbi:hypothetical protein EDC56_0447 [Sinobacterium caligoides]|uniref:Uncharacterized protein n=1 Tax=Sinobacterium caligoides TaxID=933926 RepID=A0A3N2DYJ7_9GAMM|nr:hypothetical protein [Sinobacterium caligoides]ROS04930.1 hypothetical protein EDC56_0447 [Sinobacterium caligoides]
MDLEQARALYADERYTGGLEVTDSLIAAAISLMEKFEEGIFVVIELPEDRSFHYLRINPAWWMAKPEGQWVLMSQEPFESLVKTHLKSIGKEYDGML